jgi:hypothetical protein
MIPFEVDAFELNIGFNQHVLALSAVADKI